MKKPIIILSIVGIGIFGLLYLNKNFQWLWSTNPVEVRVETGLSKSKVKIEHGISVHTIDRANDSDLFKDREKYSIVFDGQPKEKIENEYGENDFLITYHDKYYLSFRQLKLNRRHQHAYKFNFKGSEENPIVQVEIEGIDGMSFERKMIKIGNAEKYIWSKSIDTE
ncbi:MAG: hypothetical protein AAFW00_27755 [Bacteroidota bacterium]